MDLENEKVLKLIFPDGVPENLRENPELFTYLNTLGSWKLDRLKKEQTRLSDETKNILEQTQELAISNYSTFIQTAEHSRSIFKQFQNAEEQVNSLNDKLPQLSNKCETFLHDSLQINDQRHLNTITLQNNAQLLEILELPQLMERCIRESRFEEALELASCVQKMGQNQEHIPVVKSIVAAVEALWHTMLVQLVAQLRSSDLQLPKCLQIVGYLRRMQAFSNSELRLKFLQARDSWLCATLRAIPNDDAQQHLIKTIDVTRINLFNIITQYRAIFPDEEMTSSTTISNQKPLQGVACNGDRLFQAWLHSKIEAFLKTLELDLLRGITSLDTVLGQCMYFGLSFSRVGADFRALMTPVFVKVIRQKTIAGINQVNESFMREIEKYTLINKVAVHSRVAKMPAEANAAEPNIALTAESLSPPETLLDFQPLALLCNGYLNTLNELRLCAPIALASHVTNCLQQSLELVSKRILTFYRQEQQAFTASEREIFVKFCSCFAYDLLPYVQRCIHAIFPQQTLTSHLGINLLSLEKSGLTLLQQQVILLPLKALLPQREIIIAEQAAAVTAQNETKPIDVETPATVTAEG